MGDDLRESKAESESFGKFVFTGRCEHFFSVDASSEGCEAVRIVVRVQVSEVAEDSRTLMNARRKMSASHLRCMPHDILIASLLPLISANEKSEEKWRGEIVLCKI